MKKVALSICTCKMPYTIGLSKCCGRLGARACFFPFSSLKHPERREHRWAGGAGICGARSGGYAGPPNDVPVRRGRERHCHSAGRRDASGHQEGKGARWQVRGAALRTDYLMPSGTLLTRLTWQPCCANRRWMTHQVVELGCTVQHQGTPLVSSLPDAPLCPCLMHLMTTLSAVKTRIVMRSSVWLARNFSRCCSTFAAVHGNVDAVLMQYPAKKYTSSTAASLIATI